MHSQFTLLSFLMILFFSTAGWATDEEPEDFGTSHPPLILLDNNPFATDEDVSSNPDIDAFPHDLLMEDKRCLQSDESSKTPSEAPSTNRPVQEEKSPS